MALSEFQNARDDELDHSLLQNVSTTIFCYTIVPFIHLIISSKKCCFPSIFYAFLWETGRLEIGTTAWYRRPWLNRTRFKAYSSPRGGGGTQQSFIRGGCATRSKPLPFYIPFLRERVLLSYTFHRKLYPFHIPTEGLLLNFSLENSKAPKILGWISCYMRLFEIFLKYLYCLNDSFSSPFLYFNSWNPYPLIYLQLEKQQVKNCDTRTALTITQIKS